MLPTVGSETPKIVTYGATVGGRALGVAAMANLVPDPARKAAIEKAANTILVAVQDLAASYVTRFLCEFVENRIAIGKGHSVDRGFDAVVSASSEAVRTSLGDRTTRNVDYVAIFPNGAEEYTSPTVKEDDGLALDLRKAIEDSSLAVKANVLAMLDAVIPVVTEAATSVRSTEGKVNKLFEAELAGRKKVVDTLWEERKTIENALGRSGRGLARFVFFDFQKDSSQKASDVPTGTPQGTPPVDPATPEAPKAPEPT